MKKFIVTLSFIFLLQTSNAEALSCLPIDIYLDDVIGNPDTQIFIGTATEVQEHTQVVTVTKALQGWVAPELLVYHPYGNDWQYYCSNGPAKQGESTIFFIIVDRYGSFAVVQRLPANSEMAKDFLSNLTKAENIDSGITEATREDRASAVRDSISELIRALTNLFRELRYWQ